CNQIGSVADDPVITEVGGGSGFGGGGTTNVEGAVLPKSGEAGIIVAQDVGNQVGNPFINDANAVLLRLPVVQDVAITVFHVQDEYRFDAMTAVGEDAVCLY